jgi:hypothetical protein
MSGDDYLNSANLPPSATNNPGDAGQEEPAVSNPNHQAAMAAVAEAANGKDNLTQATEAASSSTSSTSGPITALDYLAQRGDQQPANPPPDSPLRPFVLFHGGKLINR